MAEKQISEVVGAPESQGFCWCPMFETYLSIPSPKTTLTSRGHGFTSPIAARLSVGTDADCCGFCWRIKMPTCAFGAVGRRSLTLKVLLIWTCEHCQQIGPVPSNETFTSFTHASYAVALGSPCVWTVYSRHIGSSQLPVVHSHRSCVIWHAVPVIIDS